MRKLSLGLPIISDEEWVCGWHWLCCVEGSKASQCMGSIGNMGSVLIVYLPIQAGLV